MTSLSWAFGAVGPFMLLMVVSNIVLYYLVYTVGLAPGLAGGLVATARMADVFFAPAVGFASDRTHSRWGRRRPYLLTAAILMPVAWLLFFNVPGKGSGAWVWALAGLLLISGCYSIFNIPHIAMANDMTKVPRARLRLMSMRTIFVMGSGIAGGALPLILQYAPAGQGYFLLSIVLCVICAGPMLIAFLGTGQTPHTAPTPSVKPRELLAGLRQNSPFMAYATGRLVAVIFTAGQMPIMLFFFQSVMKLPLSALAVFMTVSNATALVTAPAAVALANRYGKAFVRDGIIYIGGAYCLSYVFASYGPPMIGLIVRALAYGLVIGGWNLVSNAMAADVIDYDYHLTGRRREGLFAAFFSFADKTAAALGVLWVGVFLSVVGFDKSLPPGREQQPGVTLGLYVIMAALPALGYLVSLISFKFYRLDPGKGIYPAGAAPERAGA